MQHNYLILSKDPLHIKLVLCTIIRCRPIATHVPLKCKLSGVSWVHRALELGCSNGRTFKSRRAFDSCHPCAQTFLEILGSNTKRSILCPVYLISRIPVWSINNLSVLLFLKIAFTKVKTYMLLGCFQFQWC